MVENPWQKICSKKLNIPSKIAKTMEDITSTRNIASEIQNSVFYRPVDGDFHKNTSKIQVPKYFPIKSIELIMDPNFYDKLDLDTLFYVFYYYSGKVQQSYSATVLKTYAWRYHLKYKMWFQRLDEPKLITNDYEKGEFLLFDYTKGWNFMKKSDFVFEYKFLEQN